MRRKTRKSKVTKKKKVIRRRRKGKVTIAGVQIEVNPSDPTQSTLKRILEEQGIDSFTILLNGKEVDATDALPETFGNNVIEVQRYVKSGGR